MVPKFNYFWNIGLQSKSYTDEKIPAAEIIGLVRYSGRYDNRKIHAFGLY